MNLFLYIITITDHNVDFGSSSTGVQAKSIRIRYSNNPGTGYINAYADDVLIATINPPGTGDWAVFEEVLFPLDVLLEGNHTLRLDAAGPGYVMNLDWFELTGT